MKISIVSKSTGLTKKAIRYYESIGLITPKIEQNGYREYSHEDTKKLMLIKNLRKMYFSIDEIRTCLQSKDLLISCFSMKLIELEKQKENISGISNILNQAISDDCPYEIIEKIKIEQSQFDQGESNYLRYLLRQLFPGDFGEMIAAVYGQLLIEPLSSAEQKFAWDMLVSELDALEPISIPTKLAQWAQEYNNQESIKLNYLKMSNEYNQDYDLYADNKREAIQNHINEVRKKEDVSETNKVQQLTEFLLEEGKAVPEILGKYLPVISKQFQRFAIMQSKLIHDNSDLIAKLER